MYRVAFHLDFFGSSLAARSQSFRVAGAGRVRVKQDPDSFIGALDRRDYFTAKSRKPFVVVITTEASGQNSHLDGQTEILVAADEDGNPGADIFVSVSGDNSRRLQVKAPAETAA